jgi:hypothetical protein
VPLQTYLMKRSSEAQCSLSVSSTTLKQHGVHRATSVHPAALDNAHTHTHTHTHSQAPTTPNATRGVCGLERSPPFAHSN